MQNAKCKIEESTESTIEKALPLWGKVIGAVYVIARRLCAVAIRSPCRGGYYPPGGCGG